MNVQDYIDAINENAGEALRLPEHLYAEYLENEVDELLAEGWRVLLEEGKRPRDDRHFIEVQKGWNWWYRSSFGYCNLVGLVEEPPERFEGYPKDPEWLMLTFPTFFEAMNAAAIAYVRYNYDPDYGKEIISFIAYKATQNHFFGYREEEKPGGRIIHRPRLEPEHVLYENLGYYPEQLPLITKAVEEGKPVLIHMDLEEEKVKRIDCEDCYKDWGHSYCGTCKGVGYLSRKETTIVSARANARIISFVLLEIEGGLAPICNVEFYTEPTTQNIKKGR